MLEEKPMYPLTLAELAEDLDQEKEQHGK